MSVEKTPKQTPPRDIYFWLKIAFLVIGGVYLAGKVFGEFFYNLGIKI